MVRKPLIAAVEGWALGGGFEMALACDLIVAADTAKFGLTEVKRGLIAGEGGVIRLPQRLPYHIAVKVLLTGEPISAVDANQYGLISELTASGAALARAQELARRIAGNAPLALAKVKQVCETPRASMTPTRSRARPRTRTACWPPRTRTKARWRSPKNAHPSGAGANDPTQTRGATIMSTQTSVQRIAIVGTGTIGASWATHYLAHGFDVTATDPAPGAEAALRSYVEGAWDGCHQARGLRPAPRRTG